jgi:hypothetical protein
LSSWVTQTNFYNLNKKKPLIFNGSRACSLDNLVPCQVFLQMLMRDHPSAWVFSPHAVDRRHVNQRLFLGQYGNHPALKWLASLKRVAMLLLSPPCHLTFAQMFRLQITRKKNGQTTPSLSHQRPYCPINHQELVISHLNR